MCSKPLGVVLGALVVGIGFCVVFIVGCTVVAVDAECEVIHLNYIKANVLPCDGILESPFYMKSKIPRTVVCAPAVVLAGAEMYFMKLQPIV